jgi:hypothetical protein
MPSTSIGRLFITSNRIEGMCLTPLLTNSIDLCIVSSPALFGSCSSVRPIARPTAIISAKAGKSSFVVACAAGSRIHECHGCPLSAEITPTVAFLDNIACSGFLCMQRGHTIDSYKILLQDSLLRSRRLSLAGAWRSGRGDSALRGYLFLHEYLQFHDRHRSLVSPIRNR